MKFTKLKKHLAVILSAAMVFSCFPATAMAAEVDADDDTVAVEEMDAADEEVVLSSGEEDIDGEGEDSFTIEWDWENAKPASVASTNIQKTTGEVAGFSPAAKDTKLANYLEDHGVDLTKLSVDATGSGKLQYNAGGYCQYNQDTIINVPLVSGNNAVYIKAFSGQGKWTITGPGGINLEGTSLVPRPNEETVSVNNVTGYDKVLTITSTGGAYIKAIKNTVTTSAFRGDDIVVATKNVQYAVSGLLNEDVIGKVVLNDGTSDTTLTEATGTVDLVIGKTYTVKTAYGTKGIYKSESTITVSDTSSEFDIVLVPVGIDLNYVSDDGQLAIATMLGNNIATFTDTYTNDDGDAFETTHYAAGINNTYAGYGYSGKGKFMSFVADEEDKVYELKIYGTQSKGLDTVGLYRDAALTDVVAEPGSIVEEKTGKRADNQYSNTFMFSYHKVTAGAETLYVKVNGVYIVGMDIIKKDYVAPTTALYAGGVSGLLEDDPDATITVKSITDTKSFTAAEYEGGVELNLDETYTVTAKGKYVYTGEPIEVSDDPEDTTIRLKRIVFDFPIDLYGNYDDYRLYFAGLGYHDQIVGDEKWYDGNEKVTDSGITLHKGGISMSAYGKEYGAAVKGPNILSFEAKQDDTLTVYVHVTQKDAGEKLSLSKNGVPITGIKSKDSNGSEITGDASGIDLAKALGDDFAEKTGGVVPLTIDVEAGDVITLCCPTTSNFYFKGVVLEYLSDIPEWDINLAKTEAEYGDTGFVYYSNDDGSMAVSNPGSSAMAEGVKYGVSNGNNGKKTSSKDDACKGLIEILDASGNSTNSLAEGNKIQGSYTKYTAPADGTLTLKMKLNGSKEVIANYADGTTMKPICSFNFGDKDKSADDGSWSYINNTTTLVTTLNIAVKKNVTYYVTVAGSKMVAYSAQFVPYTVVSGTVSATAGSKTTNLDLKFSGSEMEEVVHVGTDSKYSVALKPGIYNITVTGAAAEDTGLNQASKKVTVEAFETAADAKQTKNLTTVTEVNYTLTGNILGLDKAYSDMKLRFMPGNTVAYDVKEATISGSASAQTYSVSLKEGVSYRVRLNGACDYVLADKYNVKLTAAGTQDIELQPLPKFTVSGNLLNVPATVNVPKITFTNLTDKNTVKVYTYETTDIANGKYTVELREGDYVASASVDGYTTDTHVVVVDADVDRDLYFNVPATTTKIPYVEEIFVGYPDKDNNYATVSDAVKAIANMDRTTKANDYESGRVTVTIAPGLYREQILVKAPNVTFRKGEGDGDVTLTWYYGIGYKYYSAKGGFYDESRAFDKYEKNAVEEWGTTVYLSKEATGFRAQDITFENSFNRYITDEELEDGVECGSWTFERTKDADVNVLAAKERACVMRIKADSAEFYNCNFLSSQDTLGTSMRGYFKDCFIEGITDYICGDGDVVFDNCELSTKGFTDKTTKDVVITAMGGGSGKDAKYTNGYLFRDCKITENGKNVPGIVSGNTATLGRPWANAPSVHVLFMNTTIVPKNHIWPEGWRDMSGSLPQNAYFTEYNTVDANGNAVDLSKRVSKKATLTDEEAAAIDPATWFGDWDPVYYEGGKVPGPGPDPEVVDEDTIDATTGDAILSKKTTEKVLSENKALAAKYGDKYFGTKKEPAYLPTLAHFEDTATVLNGFVKGKVKKVAISMNGLNEARATVNAKVTVILPEDMREGTVTLKAVSGNTLPSKARAPKIKKKTGAMTLKALKNTAEYEVVVATATKTLTIRVINLRFEKSLKTIVLRTDNVSANEILTVRPTELGAKKVEQINKPANFLSGLWIIGKDKTPTTTFDTWQAVNVKTKSTQVAPQVMVCSNGVVKLKTNGIYKGSVKLAYVLNGKKYTTVIKFVDKEKNANKRKPSAARDTYIGKGLLTTEAKEAPKQAEAAK